jgi:chromate transporter
VLIGYRFGGMPGVAVSLLGMLAPSVAITIAMTALYSQVRDWPQVQAALRGVTPALVGLSIAFMWRLLKEPLAGLQRRGRSGVTIGLTLLAVATLLTALGMPVLFAYLTGAVGLGVFYEAASRSPEERPWTG